MRAFDCLVLTSQVQTRSNIFGSSPSAVDAQKVFKRTVKELINEDYSIGSDIERYQGVLEHAFSKVNFSVAMGIHMRRSNLNLSIGKTTRHNNKNLLSNTHMKIGSNRDIKNTTLRFEEQQRKRNIPIQSLWKSLTKSWENCLN